ncbi:MAG: SMC-Scp complex subunit ScpB [Thermoanaerobaculia bacterium]
MTEERDETMPGSEPETPGPAAEALAAEAEAATRAGEPPAAGSEPEPSPPGAPAEDPLAEALPLVEALLFAASKPVALDKLAEAAELPEEVVERAVSVLEAACSASGRGVRLDRVAGGVRLVTRPEYDYPVRRLLGLDGKTKLSMAALETLAIVAYRQPVTGPEIAELRSVNSSSSIRTLLDRKLITTAGRKEVVGTPFLYKTTKEFLVHFGLKGIGDLPKPEELEAIYGLESPKPDPAQVELFHVDEATGEVEDVVDVAEAGAPAAAAEPAGETSGETIAPEPGEAAPAPDVAAAEPVGPASTTAEEEGPVEGSGSPATEEDEHAG